MFWGLAFAGASLLAAAVLVICFRPWSHSSS